MPREPEELFELFDRLLDNPDDDKLVEEADQAIADDPRSSLIAIRRHIPDEPQQILVDTASIPKATLAKTKPPEKRQVWWDPIRRRSMDPLLYCKPKSLKELTEYVQAATAQGLRVKAVGSGHSFSDVTDAPDYLIAMHGLNKKLPIAASTLKDPAAASSLVRVEGGLRICDLNRLLDDGKQAMQNLGGYTGQTIAGAIATGTHGSGITLGPLADFVESLQIVSTNGVVYQVERTNGITDKAKFPNEEDGVPVNLIQDDDTFYAVVVSMGCMGIVYSLCLRVLDRYWLRETRLIEPWAKIKVDIKDAAEVGRTRHYEVMLNPHQYKGNRACLVTRREMKTTPSSSGDPLGKIRNPLAELLQRLQGDGQVLITIMNIVPKLVPLFLNRAIGALADPEYWALWHKVFDLGPINDVRAYGIEVAVPFDQAGAAAETVFDIAAKTASLGNQYTTAPFAIRFVQESKALLAPMYKRPTCMIEMICMYGTRGHEELLRRYEAALVSRHKGRPHWGLSLGVPRGRAEVEALYPGSFATWHMKYRAFNANGTFNNAFTDRIGVSV